MDLHFTEASALAAIDRQVYNSDRDISPAQYEIVRRVIYHTADFEYVSLLRFSKDALAKGAAALTAATPIIVDVPEIQVSIVPQLQQTFLNPVYCCATSSTEANGSKTKTACGLEKLASAHPQAIYIIGSDETAFNTLHKLIASKAISPSFVIATAPRLLEPEAKFSSDSLAPVIYTAGTKGGYNVASAILKSLVSLTWKAASLSYHQN